MLQAVLTTCGPTTPGDWLTNLYAATNVEYQPSLADTRERNGTDLKNRVSPPRASVRTTRVA